MSPLKRDTRLMEKKKETTISYIGVLNKDNGKENGIYYLGFRVDGLGFGIWGLCFGLGGYCTKII